jgi:hypothetical protein
MKSKPPSRSPDRGKLMNFYALKEHFSNSPGQSDEGTTPRVKGNIKNTVREYMLFNEIFFFGRNGKS